MDPIATVIVTLTADGRVSLNATGPSAANQVLLLGLLEVAKAALLNQPKATEPAMPILLARGSLPVNGR